MDTLLLDYDEEVVPEELVELGSFNHGYLQARLIVLLSMLKLYTVVSEISLSAIGLETPYLQEMFRSEIKPDVAVYAKRQINYLLDEIRMAEMPLLAIEILSPAQGQQRLLHKINALFELGVQSCWLVNPGMMTIAVFSDANTFVTYPHGTVHDTVLDISLGHAEIFD